MLWFRWMWVTRPLRKRNSNQEIHFKANANAFSSYISMQLHRFKKGQLYGTVNLFAKS